MRFVVRRLARLVLSLMVVVTASFAMIHLIPGDPVRAALGPTASAEVVAARRAELGLDKPLHTQFWDYLTGLFHGELGTSIISQEPVRQVIADRLPSTLQLAALSVPITLLLAVPLGMWLAARTENGRHRGTEMAFASMSGVILAVPEFVIAITLVVVFAVTFKWLPPGGKEGASTFVLPVTALALGPVALISRLVRLETLRVLGEEYVRVARAKRLKPARLYLWHVLPNTLTATLTIAGMLLAGAVAGSVIVENVFAWPGVGSRVVQSITNKDYPVAQGIVLLYGVVILTVNIGVDILLALADPRSQIRRS
ncbi:ABC transporter permease [Actinomadura rubrisoli]|uniref:ABC transporter permease n=1 Tax=Actinomadura rubrisoli TaxID=2530368 RepID=A0A4R5BW02_9ACTN|nr:ABC transporter permease [Actinomadura rubrisoli]TDD90385.1 ABC transporter permease [Actinomadura rubrisoli]